MKPKYSILAAVSALVLVLDQWSKVYIDKSMTLHSSYPVIEGFFNITYLRNKGAAFGILASSSYRLPFFLLVSSIAVIVILVAVSKMRDDQTWNVASLSLIFSGALGNMIDRVRLGEVIDFLDVHWKGHHWPAFNIADSAICVGVFILAVDMVLEERREKKNPPTQDAH
ncbi:signal peptidase II [Geomonas azotofigens]|uniref:signal peptidase II n=1 Tax=Geomonas azotofigens TaxID=2843196 RepID=UPI001C111AD5|nr:signal peptidase II [Geomonas azotofigens]MBU5611413.1 signal peptidase II [Geomonas azotofigens]